MSWVETSIGETLVFNYGKSLPDRNRNDGEFSVYGSGGVVGSHDRALVTGPGIVVGRKGTIGATHWTESDFFPIDTTYFVTPKRADVDLRYAYFLVKSLPLASMNSDAAVPGLNRENAYRLKIKLPELEAQQSIAAILATYDDLIENNRRRIALLEEAARQLYKEWFVRFRFPGHEHVKIIDGVPEGWKCRTLRDVATLHYGKALKEETRTPGDVPVYGSSGIVGSHDKALVSGPGIILGRKGNVGSVRWSHSDFFPIDTVYFIVSEQSNFHLYLTLQQMQFMSTDVAVPGLNRDFAYSRFLVRPSNVVGARFEEEVTPIFLQMQKLTDWNEKLAKARDLLLPKLMSGAIAV
ncbi:restriction endonuclease subunit S [Sphingopyxis witflariensis]|uniref:restriction endonuclease subunit S n=1 Tax=Sphingopyxis witflariensis TaxID=173675 RepID=UPI001303BC59|nr:restriction endonuclease subunit S [Sphingopyxis witflariensis]